MRDALKSNSQSDVEGHPAIASNQSNLADILMDRGKLKEARELLTVAEAALLEKLGPDHRHTRTAQSRLERLGSMESKSPDRIPTPEDEKT